MAIESRINRTLSQINEENEDDISELAKNMYTPNTNRSNLKQSFIGSFVGSAGDHSPLPHNVDLASANIITSLERANSV